MQTELLGCRGRHERISVCGAHLSLAELGWSQTFDETTSYSGYSRTCVPARRQRLALVMNALAARERVRVPWFLRTKPATQQNATESARAPRLRSTHFSGRHRLFNPHRVTSVVLRTCSFKFVTTSRPQTPDTSIRRVNTSRQSWRSTRRCSTTPCRWG